MNSHENPGTADHAPSTGEQTKAGRDEVISKISQPTRMAELEIQTGFSFISKPGFFLEPHGHLTRMGDGEWQETSGQLPSHLPKPRDATLLSKATTMPCTTTQQCNRKTNVPRDLEWKKGYSRGMETVWTLKTGEAKKCYGDLSGAYFQSKKRNRCTCRCR